MRIPADPEPSGRGRSGRKWSSVDPAERLFSEKTSIWQTLTEVSRRNPPKSAEISSCARTTPDPILSSVFVRFSPL
jgi:hypothetical protein